MFLRSLSIIVADWVTVIPQNCHRVRRPITCIMEQVLEVTFLLVRFGLFSLYNQLQRLAQILQFEVLVIEFESLFVL